MEDLGAVSGSRASTKPASGLGPSGFDPGELARRCEEAGGPDRELDVVLAFVAGIIHEPEFERGYFYGANCDYVLERGDYDHGNNAPELPHYTASLDAAMTLVPEGAWWNVEGSAENGYSACTLTPNECIARTPALALCAAALKARALAPTDTRSAKT